MQILLQVCIMAIYKYSISYISYNDTHKSQNNLFRRCVSELHLHTVNMYNPVYMYMYYRHLIYVSAHYSYYYYIILQSIDIWESNLVWGSKLLTHMGEQIIIFYVCI